MIDCLIAPGRFDPDVQKFRDVVPSTEIVQLPTHAHARNIRSPSPSEILISRTWCP